ncbi:glutaminyl-peptide cyclotransferase [Rhodopila globiformis]|uniref:Glutamine cyclotransferase n=1 Tax=Rhodopila globiformis TaxID=1071 RepID=A0A2S6NJM4_RHOGL|nr:glutaminyl-peptide cyclotransferase [Rhodopila globiformis]PPQ35107.1 glutamine cyclotransferase [Rhodopila globiformis]
MQAWRFRAAVGLIAGLTAAFAACAAVPEYVVSVQKTYPHDPLAFTEGLLYHNGFLYESTGLEGHSSIRKVVLATGKVVQERDIDPRYFGEGIVIWKNRLIELTWKSEIGFAYDARSFAPLSSFHYTGQGWALTRDRTHIFMSDGTSDLRVLDPGSLKETSRIHVTCDGRPLQAINELEWVNGEIYANIWQTNVIARIDPASGHVVGLIDLSDLAAWIGVGHHVDVLNGIAYDAKGKRLFVTGKFWPSLFQIALIPRTAAKDLCGKLP